MPDAESTRSRVKNYRGISFTDWMRTERKRAGREGGVVTPSCAKALIQTSKPWTLCWHSSAHTTLCIPLNTQETISTSCTESTIQEKPRTSSKLEIQLQRATSCKGARKKLKGVFHNSQSNQSHQVLLCYLLFQKNEVPPSQYLQQLSQVYNSGRRTGLHQA